MDSLERTRSINPDFGEHSHGRVGRRVIYVGGAYCPESEPRAAEPPEPHRTLDQPITYTRGDGPVEPVELTGTALDRMVAGWPTPLRVAMVVLVLVVGAVAMVTAGAGVGIILTGGSPLP